MPDISILGIPGSLRKESFNKRALLAARELLPQGAHLEVFELGGIPPFNQDDERNPPSRVAELKSRVRAADAVLIATPEYNYSIPGVLKNAIDWASRPYGDSAWSGKLVGLMGASVGLFGSIRAQYHLRQCFVFLDVQTLNQPEVAIGSAAQRFDAQGKLVDETSRKLIEQLLRNLVERARMKAAA